LNSQDRERAMFYLARSYQITGQESAALKTFKEVLRRYPKGAYGTLAGKYIRKIEDKEGEES
jgi:outer membrane protein assembly factor BamD (BamD/ComL family)